MSTQGIKRARYRCSSGRAGHPDAAWLRVASDVSRSATRKPEPV